MLTPYLSTPAQAYLAAQQVGPAPEETDEQKRRGSLRRKLALFALIVLIGGGETYLICTENERVLAMCMRYMLAVFYQMVLTSVSLTTLVISSKVAEL